MKYEKSEWFKGLLFAEQQSQDGWRVCDCEFQPMIHKVSQTK